MHSLRRIWHWVRSQNKTLFSTRFLFQWQFFSSYLNSSCNMISENVDHFLNSWRFIMRETGKVSQIILNYQERILHLSNFFSKPDIFPWKIEGTGGIFLSIVHDEEMQENMCYGISRRTQKYSDHWFSVCFPKMMEAASLSFFEFLRKSWCCLLYTSPSPRD